MFVTKLLQSFLLLLLPSVSSLAAVPHRPTMSSCARIRPTTALCRPARDGHLTAAPFHFP